MVQQLVRPARRVDVEWVLDHRAMAWSWQQCTDGHPEGPDGWKPTKAAIHKACKDIDTFPPEAVQDDLLPWAIGWDHRNAWSVPRCRAAAKRYGRRLPLSDREERELAQLEERIKSTAGDRGVIVYVGDGRFAIRPRNPGEQVYAKWLAYKL